MMLLILLAVAAQLADLFTFVVMLDAHGIQAEANPIVVAIFGWEPLALVPLKIGAILFGVYVYDRLIQDGHRSMALGLGVWMLTVGAIGAASNILTIR